MMTKQSLGWQTAALNIMTLNFVKQTLNVNQEISNIANEKLNDVKCC